MQLLQKKLLMSLFIVIALILLFTFAWRKKLSAPESTNDLPDIEQTKSTHDVSLTSDKGVTLYLDEPKPKITISSPLTISGNAPGFWFFEGDAPITLTNWDGLIIAEGYITAQGGWMTTDYVPFAGTIDFEKPEYGERGFLILHRDNPSDLSENDDAVEIMVFFE